MANSFTNFKEQFYSKFESAEIFDCGDFNSLKIVLDGLKVNYNQYQIPESFFRFNWFVFASYRFLKRTMYWNKKYQTQFLRVKQALNQDKKIYVGDSPRSLKGPAEADYSLYYTNIVNSLGAENCMLVTKEHTRKNKMPSIDLLIEEIYAAANCIAMDGEDKELFMVLKKNLNTLSSLGIFSDDELRNIEKAYDNFFHQVFIWNHFFKQSQLTHLVVTVHYHREGMIYAARKNNIRVIELQHGLIAHEDIFYNFPSKVKPVMPKALFADKILVYGHAWKERLLKGAEYQAQQIDILGYYHFQHNQPTAADTALLEKIGDRKIILFTTQTYMEKQFVAYIKKFEDALNKDFVLLIKPHPLEKKHFYTDAFSEHNNIFITESNLDFLFQHAYCNVTCYSTTVFDAIRNGVKSIAINFLNCADYVQGFVDAGVVIRVEENEWIGDAIPQLAQLNCKADDWYQSFTPSTLSAALV